MKSITKVELIMMLMINKLILNIPNEISGFEVYQDISSNLNKRTLI